MSYSTIVDVWLSDVILVDRCKNCSDTANDSQF